MGEKWIIIICNGQSTRQKDEKSKKILSSPNNFFNSRRLEINAFFSSLSKIFNLIVDRLMQEKVFFFPQNIVHFKISYK